MKRPGEILDDFSINFPIRSLCHDLEDASRYTVDDVMFVCS